MPELHGRVADRIPKDQRVVPRPVAVAIPYAHDAQAQTLIKARVGDGDREEPLICLVSSRKHEKGYVLPKGGIEEGEDGRQAAVRELWEEAGLLPADAHAELAKREVPDNETLDHKPHKRSPAKDAQSPLFIARAMYSAFEIPVDFATGQAESWPEQHERYRIWKPISEAADLIAWRPDIHRLLHASSLGQMYLAGNATLS